MQDVDRPTHVQALSQPTRARRPRVQAKPLRVVPRSEDVHGIVEHPRRRGHLPQDPAVRAAELKVAVGLSLELVALLVDRAVVPATEQGEVRERRRAALRPVPDVMSLAERKPAAWEAAAPVSVMERAP